MGIMATSRDQDALLLKAIREGDVSAFEQLYQRFAPGLLGYILQRVPSRPEAEELLQETFVRLLRDKRFEPDRAGLGTYLYVVARNLCLNFLRDHGSKRSVALEESTTSHTESLWLKPTEAPDERLGKRQQLGELARALELLPEVQREAFLLRHHHGRSYQEIAEISNCPVGTAKSRVHLALSALRAALEPAIDNVTPLFSARHGR
jgi:RNA polymerase sigma-70 factor (ECF subfamily)